MTIAVEPPTIVPMRNSRANTRKVGMGSLESVSGSSAMTPLSVRISLKIMTTTVLSMMLSSKALEK